MAQTDEFVQHCFYHPNVETRLRCSRCEKPICPRCMVPSPVGYRCPDCARGPRPAVYTVATTSVALAAAVGVVVALAVGLLWGYLPEWRFYLTLALGFGVAESIAYVAKYRRGRELMTVAMLCITLGLVVSRFAIAAFDDLLTVDMLLNETSNRLVAERFQLDPIPDVLFMILPYVIQYIRFR